VISLFRRSLTARAVLTTILLGGLSVLIIGGFLSYSLANSFYQNRLSQVLTETERAVDSVQTTIAASSLNDETSLQTLLNSVVPSLEISGGSTPRQVALLRSPGQAQLQLFQSPISQDLDLAAIPDEVVDALIVHGSPEYCRDRIRQYFDNGVTTSSLAMMPFDPELNYWDAVKSLSPAAHK